MFHVHNYILGLLWVKKVPVLLLVATRWIRAIHRHVLGTWRKPLCATRAL